MIRARSPPPPPNCSLNSMCPSRRLHTAIENTQSRTSVATGDYGFAVTSRYKLLGLLANAQCIWVQSFGVSGVPAQARKVCPVHKRDRPLQTKSRRWDSRPRRRPISTLKDEHASGPDVREICTEHG